MYKRQIVPVPEVALHLIWATDKIYIKPLPRFLLSDAFYERYLKPGSTKEPGHGQDALGLLFSYITLVPTETDFDIALKEHLMPTKYTWEEWRQRAAQVLHYYPEDEIYRNTPRRYIYGELRHDRLDKVYRYLHGHWHHGYSPLMGASTYGSSVHDKLGPITAATVYIILVLTAMQVMLAAAEVSTELGSTSYGFSIFSIVGPLACVAVIVLLLGLLILVNWIKTLRTQKVRFAQLGRAPKQSEVRHRTAKYSTGIEMTRFEPIDQPRA